ncbi:DEAD/DEAH box helicase [Adhaeretor mobilis]|uniref:Putative ATP-dependent helicase Lhr n=1 Tax=Adhaeretor mobilis TaxID=1930276 RepID=A0A517MR45_9BACT|nr:DEAD/DEAH box helicase [Adhaeretor mobilis]QDS97352.1 putative ATP-dependent helicase Lhr [Adhaeretor mobilis]
MDVPALIDRMQSRRDYAGQLEHLEVLPERPGRFSAPSVPLPAALQRVIKSRGITELYLHQTAALEAARSGQDWVTVTGTASGKTLCYQLPIFESLLSKSTRGGDAPARALCLYPTKALAQDQLKGVLELVADDEELAKAVHPGVFDGDTPTAQRKRIRNEATLVLSNPDMLHAAILPYHPKWAEFFTSLKFVVIDEVHTYRGILGAHVSAVLRRLKRICKHYGSNPTFLSTSATIANPGQLVGKLLDRELKVIDDDGSPRGRKYFAMWNPVPLATKQGSADSLARRSAADDAVTWMVEALQAGGQALAFTRTRQAAELVHRYTTEQLAEQRSPHVDKVRAYRGGYLPNERRQIEEDLFSGKLRGVATTNALELGIDIGSLDVALMVNYPGTIASCWQQAGRSGRTTEESLAVLLAGNDPVDQYLLRHPEYFFAQSPEHAVVDANNPYVLAKHLPCAAFELPLTEEDFATFGPLSEPIVDVLCEEEHLAEVRGQFYHPGGSNPSVAVSLRNMSDNTVSIVLVNGPDWKKPLGPTLDNLGRHEAGMQAHRTKSKPRTGSATTGHVVLANVDSISAPDLVYPEAIYLHNGQTHLVRELDLNGKLAYVERRETDYYTQAVVESNVLITEERKLNDDREPSQASRGAPAPSDLSTHATLGYGDVDVSWQTVAFKKIKFGTKENIGMGPVDIPAQQLSTTALWLAPNEDIRIAMKAAGLKASEGLVGLRNLAVVTLPMIAMCDSRDLGGVVDSQNLGRPTMILYDRYPGGLGYCEQGRRQIGNLLELCQQLVDECPCEEGCPSCVGLAEASGGVHSDPDLRRGHPMPNKQATLKLLELLFEPTLVEVSSVGVSEVVVG